MLNLIEVRTKIKSDIEQDLREIESITEPNSIYPKNLELPDRLPKKRGRVQYDPATNSFEEFMESTQ